MPAITIRRARRVAASDACRLLLGSEPWKTLGLTRREARGLAALSGAYYLTASRGRELLGFACIQPDFLLGEYLKILVVDSAARSKGIGRNLMRSWERRSLRSQKNLYLCVSDFNRGARRFYSGLGYQAIGRVKNLVIKGSDELLLRKTSGPYRTR